MNIKTIAIWVGLLASAVPVLADVSVLVAIEPTSRKDGYLLSRSGLEAGLGKALGQAVSVTITEDLTDAMRSTRSSGYDIFIAPAQVAASSINHGYVLLGSTDPEEKYVLIGKAGVADVGALRQTRMYLPQQDSIYTYLARGLLTANGLSFKDMRKMEYARYPQAGLTAIAMHSAEATVVRTDDWERWQKDNKGVAKILATSGTVPGGFSVTVKKSLSDEMSTELNKWFSNPARNGGMKPPQERVDVSHYKKIAELGTFTPNNLPGAILVSAAEVKQLQAQGAVVVDTRTEKEFKQKHIPSALFVPYHEKSLKDVVFDSALDDFGGLKTLNPKTPTIFHCNGAECWKSYKASRAAIAGGFAKVYWYRGGMPDWETSGQLLAKD